MRAAFALACGIALSVLGGAAAHAQDFPTKPVHIVVPYAPGGTWDITGRLLAEGMKKALGQPVIIENMEGGGSVIATQHVANADPDGYTVLLASGAFSINPSLRKKLPYDTLKDFEPVSLIITPPYVLTVSNGLGVSTVAELLAKAKAEPGAINFASQGVGTSGHLTTELFKLMTGAEITHVPYTGANPAFTDLVAGRVQMFFGGFISAKSFVDSGQIRAIGVSTPERSPAMPDVPAVAETVPGFSSSSWGGLVVPAGTPADVVEKLHAAAAAAVKDEAFKTAMMRDGVTPIGSSPTEFRAFLEDEIAKWQKVVAAAEIKM